MQKIEGQLIELGYQIVAVSPDKPEKLAATKDKQATTYTLVSDSDATGIKGFGVAYRMDDQTFDTYKNKYRSTWKNLPAPSTISYRRPLCLLSVEKARSFFSTSILITKCVCTRRFFWQRPRPMPRNDPEGTARRFKGVACQHSHMIRGCSRCLSLSRRTIQNEAWLVNEMRAQCPTNFQFVAVGQEGAQFLSGDLLIRPPQTEVCRTFGVACFVRRPHSK